MSAPVFEVISKIADIKIIAVGGSIRDLEWLQQTYGRGRWRKLKGFARVRFLPAFGFWMMAKSSTPRCIGTKRTASAK